MALRDKIIFWILGIVTFWWFMYSIKSILFPFVVALIVAYFLDPLADKLEKLKLPRSIAALTIISIFISIIIIFFILIIPILYEELLALLSSIPAYYDIFLNELYPKIVNYLKLAGYEIDYDFRQYLSQDKFSRLINFSESTLSTITRSSIAVINVLSLLFITPILVYYILKDWDLLISNVNKCLPSKYAPQIRKIFADIDKNLSGYIRGQFNVCLLLGTFYAIGLLAIDLNFGILIGFLTGIFSFVPYVGMLVGVFIATIVALFQWGFDPTQLGLMAIVFISGQFIEGSFLTPKLVGKKIGLHPVWVIFAIFAFGVLFGFCGVLLAVPLAAIVGAIVNFLIDEYKKKFIK